MPPRFPLQKMINEHDQFRPALSLKKNLGDGFLISHNPVFRRIRSAAKHLKVKFDDQRFYHYDVLALTQLPRILKSNTVPYVDNVGAIREIESALPGKFSWNELPPLRANYVLHESAHLVAHHLLRQTLGRRLYGKGVSDERKTLAIFLEESFANASESFCNLYANTPLHQLFLAKNIYIIENDQTRKQIGEGIVRFGAEEIAQLVIISFVFANFLRSPISTSEWKRVLELIFPRASKFTLKEMSTLKAIFKSGFDLDPAFTYETNRFCLPLAGVQKKFSQLFRYPFLTELESDERYRSSLIQMSRILTSD